MAYDEAREAEREPPDYRGELLMRRVFAVCCGGCDRCDDVPAATATEARRWLRDRGWHLARYDGWLCVACWRR
jgi:hypothetical protein